MYQFHYATYITPERLHWANGKVYRKLKQVLVKSFFVHSVAMPLAVIISVVFTVLDIYEHIVRSFLPKLLATKAVGHMHHGLLEFQMLSHGYIVFSSALVRTAQSLHFLMLSLLAAFGIIGRIIDSLTTEL